jgi:hypothetical protein
VRRRYIGALRAAEHHDIGPLLAFARSQSLIVIIAAINTFMIIMISSNSSSSNNDNDYSSLRGVRYVTSGGVASAPVLGVGFSGNMTAESTKNRTVAQG